ncbi:hypothetical protein H113_03262 [Trichophyton rubrum MR1459]|uniref:Uncharacterized protein n=1 Tax=Trichophyton rubrum CBS 288.86 TaxID=1215330 RepID=A0A022W611_TRIRU|nr:hypothetical protein H103_03261 [Trichophyton rubrum CBS 288.86]EZF96566.1 hypothetical protein H113_03262 [Trichophyton rubrum MR1459]EZG18151.1 hypothetical protein H107_03357 [Trichophyton rubrum CBS 202.88]
MHCIAAIDDYPDKLGGLTRCKHPIIELMLDHNFARRFSAPGSNIGSRPTIIVLLFGQFPGVGANASLQDTLSFFASPSPYSHSIWVWVQEPEDEAHG